MVARLAVFAHPDDESWAAGGLIARRGDVHVVCLTAGEAGPGEVSRRPAELAAACAVLGATFEIVGLPDGLARLQGKIMGALPIKIFSTDNYLSLQVDSEIMRPWRSYP